MFKRFSVLISIGAYFVLSCAFQGGKEQHSVHSAYFSSHQIIKSTDRIEFILRDTPIDRDEAVSDILGTVFIQDFIQYDGAKKARRNRQSFTLLLHSILVPEIIQLINEATQTKIRIDEHYTKLQLNCDGPFRPFNLEYRSLPPPEETISLNIYVNGEFFKAFTVYENLFIALSCTRSKNIVCDGYLDLKNLIPKAQVDEIKALWHLKNIKYNAPPNIEE